MSLPTLYKRNSNGKLQQWTITPVATGFTTTEGIVGGKLTTSAIHTVEPKNTGKANATTAAEQAKKEAKAKWDKKLRTGYTISADTVDETEFFKPMKGYKYSERRDEIVWPVLIQAKLNGIRCQNTAKGAFSTGGKLFHTIPHIRRALQPIFDKYPDAFIDGEAFNFDMRTRLNRLIEIVSVVYQPKDITDEMLAESENLVKLYIFDGWGFAGITKDTPWVERYAGLLNLMMTTGDSSHLEVLPYEGASNEQELFAILEENKKNDGEGLMVRWGNCEYKHGKSKYMLKLKHMEDDEFTIVDIQDGNGDWVGCAKRVILNLHKPTPDGETTFGSNIEGDREWLRALYNRRSEFIGEQATVKYQALSEYGVPAIPFVVAIRNYEK